MLNPRVIAIQGIGFSPVYIAVQGLLALLEEERRTNTVGGGGRARGGAKSPAKAAARQRQAPKPEKSYSEADIVRLVEEKYAILEAKKEAALELKPAALDHIADAGEVITEPAVVAPVVLAFPLAQTVAPLPTLPQVATPIDPAVKAAKAQERAAQEARTQALAQQEQERTAKAAKAKRDEAAIVMMMMEL